MRLLIILVITIFSFSCSKKDNYKSSRNNSSETSKDDTSRYNLTVLNENIHYVGFIDKFYFSNKNEIYIQLYFNQDEISNEEYEKIENLADSLIYKDDENCRRKFPTSLSSKYFDLRGLSNLIIYDDSNRFVSNAEFVRVEFLNQNISPCFIAVYKPDKKIRTDKLYGISNFNGEIDPANYRINKDTVSTQNILDKLKANRPYNGLADNGFHIQLKNSNKTLSILNSDEYFFIILTSGEDFRILYKSSETENISKLKVLPLMKDDFPYLLTRNIKPETDVMWDNLLYYDGTKYISTRRQRIE